MYCKWKDNWKESKLNYTRWWHGEGLVISNWGSGISVAEPLHRAVHPAGHTSLEQKYTDPGWIAAAENYRLACLSTPLDMLPIAFPDIGTVSLAPILGAGTELAEDNIWYKHDSRFGPDSDRKLIFNEKNPWWEIVSESAKAVKNISRSNYFTGCPAICPNLDVLAQIRGTENLMMDLVLSPDWVHTKLDEIETAFEVAYHKLYEIICEEDGSSVMGYFMVWAPGTICLAQCDTAAMISEEMFREFAMPYLRRQCDFLDYSLYHVDGPMALKTIDPILEIDSLNAVEFTPGPNVPKGGNPHWWDLYARIKGAGKSVQIVGVEVDQVVPILDTLGPMGTCLHIDCSDLKRLEKLARDIEPYKTSIKADVTGR